MIPDNTECQIKVLLKDAGDRKLKHKWTERQRAPEIEWAENITFTARDFNLADIVLDIELHAVGVLKHVCIAKGSIGFGGDRADAVQHLWNDLIEKNYVNSFWLDMYESIK